MDDRDTEYAAKVAALNDAFRKSGFGVVMTQGIQTMDVHGIMARVRSYGDFDEDDDPYMEHDFGSLEWEGQKVFWKISYYDESLRYGEDPLSPRCKRVLTVMLAEEY